MRGEPRTPSEPVAPPDVTVIIVSYNTRELTLACLRSLFAETRDVRFECRVVDNASTDGSAAAIAEQFPQVRLDARKDNLGFAAANNRAARDAHSPYLLLLNPDTVVLDGAVDRLVAFARQHPDRRIYGGRTLFADGALNPTSCWRRSTLWSEFCHAVGLTACFRGSAWLNPEAYGGWPRDSVREVDLVSGCFFLIERELWEQLGGFDPAFFMYGEEADLCLRARRLGARPTVCPHATIVHYGGKSERQRAGKLVRMLRARRMLMQRHWPRWQRATGRFVQRLGVRIRRWGFAIAARLGRAAARESAATYEEVWRRRSEWDIRDEAAGEAAAQAREARHVGA
ncbi:MAG: glycosyltransferase [Planctomycetota bacterium]|nr:MAG: glycosyltransferase [Planctomycetota bacterium]